MSDAERTQLVENIAQRVFDKIFQASTDEEKVGKVVDTAVSQVQRAVGRAVIRGIFYILVAGMFLASLKIGLIDWISRVTGK